MKQVTIINPNSYQKESKQETRLIASRLVINNHIQELNKLGKFRNYRYGNTKRLYGDYLYAQDRIMFNESLRESLKSTGV